MKPKLTRWLHAPKNIPYRPGVYEITFVANLDSRHRYYRKWDGEHWHYLSASVSGAAATDFRVSWDVYPFWWRGLASDPNGSQ